jgi:hypothetical protein
MSDIILDEYVEVVRGKLVRSPGPSEIAASAAEIRNSWSPEERALRKRGIIPTDPTKR